MGSLFYNSKERQNPLMDFAEILFGETPQTITQAGIDDDAERFRLKFDGSKLRLLQGDKELMNWNGVSGRPGYQNPIFQNLENKGPIPEGNYDVRKDNHQEIGYWDTFLGLPGLLGVNAGKWPKAQFAWGTDRIWLKPDQNTNTHGRKNFSIHGGITPGSAGCIDLTWDNDDFMKTFLTIEKDMPLEVNYKIKK